MRLQQTPEGVVGSHRIDVGSAIDRHIPWPDAVAYSEAIQNPSATLSDPALAGAAVSLDRRGLPIAYTGRFAIVFRVHAEGADWAVRCFTSPDVTGERHNHYVALQSALDVLRAKGAPVARSLAQFRFLPSGIQVGDARYPVVAMHWGAGVSLMRFVERHLADADALRRLVASLGQLLLDLESAEMVHGDWQHDNLLVSNHGATVTPVDYDGMVLPGMNRDVVAERGHPNYQHPSRTQGRASGDAVGNPDRFSCHVLQTALLALSVEPGLWEERNDGDSILFTSSDFAAIETSITLGAIRLVAYDHSDVVSAVVALETACRAENLSQVDLPPVHIAPLARTDTPPDDGPQASVLEHRQDPLAVSVAHQPPKYAGSGTWTNGATAAMPRSVAAPLSERAMLAATPLRATLHKKMAAYQRTDRIYFWSVRAALMALYWLFYVSNVVEFGSFHGFFAVLTFLTLAYYVWPRNHQNLYLRRLEAQCKGIVSAIVTHQTRVGTQLAKLSQDPANSSPVTFIGAELQLTDLETAMRAAFPEVPDSEYEILRKFGLTRVGDITAGTSIPVQPDTLRALSGVRTRSIDAARHGFRALTEHRRHLQSDADAAMDELAGIRLVEMEINEAREKLPPARFWRFLVRICGLPA